MLRTEDWVDRHVQIYPNDSHKKFGRVVAVDEHGFTIEITHAEKATAYREGQLVYYAHSTGLVLAEVPAYVAQGDS